MSHLIDFEPPALTVPAPADDAAPADLTRQRDQLPLPKRAQPRDRLAQPREALVSRAVRLAERARPGLRRGWSATGPVRRWLVKLAKSVTGLGWAVLSVGASAWLAGGLFGWAEAGIIAAFCFAGLALAGLFTIGRTRVEMKLTLAPQRVRVHQSAIASFEMTNISARRQGSVNVRLTIGATAAHLSAPGLAPGQSYDDWVTIPTNRRSVVPVGPVLTYRGDPWGMVRREVAWTEVIELFIHPDITAVDEISSGLLRDLEGQSTLDVSNSDLAFHALRDYLPGDDQRYIHWKSSARLSAVSGEDKFMVRQFLDTRKSHLAVVSDLNAVHFADEAEFETALSCAASVTARAVMDDMDLTVICGDQVVHCPKSNYALDAYSRAESGERSLEAEFERLVFRAPDASMVVLVTGALTDFADLQRGRAILAAPVRFLVIRVVTGAPITLRQSGGLAELTVGSLADLPRALRGGLS